MALPVSPDAAPKVNKRERPADGKKVQAIFCEVFSGKGVLTEEVKNMGIQVEVPDDFSNGGTDFRDSK